MKTAGVLFQPTSAASVMKRFQQSRQSVVMCCSHVIWSGGFIVFTDQRSWTEAMYATRCDESVQTCVRLSLEVKKTINSPLNCQLLQFLAARRLEKFFLLQLLLKAKQKASVNHDFKKESYKVGQSKSFQWFRKSICTVAPFSTEFSVEISWNPPGSLYTELKPNVSDLAVIFLLLSNCWNRESPEEHRALPTFIKAPETETVKPQPENKETQWGLIYWGCNNWLYCVGVCSVEAWLNMKRPQQTEVCFPSLTNPQTVFPSLFKQNTEQVIVELRAKSGTNMRSNWFFR